MTDLELQVQKGWLELAVETLKAIESIWQQKKTADAQCTVLLELQEDEFEKRYNRYLDQLLTNHINIEHLKYPA